MSLYAIIKLVCISFRRERKANYKMAEIRERKLHFDLLRILAAFSVVMLHTSAQFWYTLDMHSTDWMIANGYNALFRFGVPIFVMLSGALFLDKNYKLNLKRLYHNNILRLVVLYVIWSCLYGLFDCMSFQWELLTAKDFFREILSGRYHLWFLPMLVGIYVLLPILKGWIECAEKKDIQYFLALFFVLQICRETIKVITVTDELEYILDLGKVEMACGYIGYFVLGYYLAHVGISAKMRRLLYWLVIPALPANIVLGTVFVLRDGVASPVLYDSYGLFTFIISAALFMYAVDKKDSISLGEKGIRVVRELSADTLGAYVLHIGVLEFLQSKGIHSMLLPNIIGIPLLAVCCFGVCMLAAGVLRRIPVVGKYLC